MESFTTYFIICWLNMKLHQNKKKSNYLLPKFCLIKTDFRPLDAPSYTRLLASQSYYEYIPA